MDIEKLIEQVIYCGCHISDCRNCKFLEGIRCGLTDVNHSGYNLHKKRIELMNLIINYYQQGESAMIQELREWAKKNTILAFDKEAVGFNKALDALDSKLDSMQEVIR